MRRMTVAVLGALALLTAGCSGCAVLDPSSGVLTQTALDEKALYGAEAMFFGANQAASAAVDAGVLVGGSARAVMVADGLAEAKLALDAARAAYRAGDATSYAGKIAATQQLVAATWAAIPGKAH